MANIRVESREFQVDLGFGRARNPNGEFLGSVFKYGSSDNVTTSDTAIQFQGGAFVFPASAQRVRIKLGGDVADTAAGTGVREVEIFGILGDGTWGSETIATAGASASAYTTNTWWRVYRVRPSVVGAYDGVNVGDVIIENETDAAELIYMPAGLGSSLHLAWATGSDQKALVSTLTVSVESNKAADIRIWTRENLTNTGVPYSSKLIRQEFKSVPSGLYSVPREPYLFLPPLTDVWVTAKVPVGTAEVSGALSIIVSPA